MDFLRRHAFLIVCGVVGAGGVVLGVDGLRAGPRVLAAMEEAQGLHRDLQSLRNNSVNQEAIEAEQQRIDQVKDDYAKVIAKAEKLYGYEPLVEGALPDGNKAARYRFREEYSTAMEALLETLVCGGPPGQGETDDMQDRISQESWEREAPAREVDGTPPAPFIEGPFRTPAGVLTEEGVRQDAEARVSIRRAQQLRCYATGFGTSESREVVPGLDFHFYMQEGDGLEAPELVDVWEAQLGYWIQKDVVEAIVAVNQEAADGLQRDDRWVGVMPVKEVISIRVSQGAVPPVGEGDLTYGHAPGGYDDALPPGSAETVFTGLGSTDTFDVMQFAVKLVMDQRDIPRLIERLTADSLHTVLRVSYQAVPVNRDLKGKIYGPEPTVNVVMDFETILLNEVFGQFKPKDQEDDA